MLVSCYLFSGSATNVCLPTDRKRESSLNRILAGMPIHLNLKNMNHISCLGMKTNRYDINRGKNYFNIDSRKVH